MSETMAIAAYLVLMNLITFATYGIDKSRARRGEWRISEKMLIALALLGGSLGAFLGMRVFHHKTRKPLFRILIPLLLVLDIVVFGSALYLSDYYHADDSALAALEQTDEVEVQDLGDCVAFVPREPIAGFVFYPGAKVQAESYAPLLGRCAQRGVLCVLVRAPFNFALLDVSAADRAFEAFPDVEEWMLAGHSLGGVAACEFAENHPADVDGIVLLASYPSVDLSNVDAHALLVVGSNDGVLNRDAYEEARAKLPATVDELVIEGGNHAYFGDYGEQNGDGEASISRESQQSQTADAIVALAEELS